MELKEQHDQDNREMFRRWEEQHRRGKLFAGLVIAVIGALYLAREMGVVMPEWLFTWQMLIVVVGLYSGVKHAFRNIGWLIMVMIGTAFLLKDYMPGYDFTHYIWPAMLILLGLYIMIRPRRRCYGRRRWERWEQRHGRWNRWEKQHMQETYVQETSKDDYLDISAVLGGVKKNVISKDFRGGEINCVFGGGEINLSQADINGTVELEVNAVFGGVRLVVPAHWEIKSELTAVLGNVEDKRPLRPESSNVQNKVLVLRGTAVFGGIEIQSY